MTNEPMQPVTPIDTVGLFPPLSAALLSLLRSLTADEWQRPTACGDWSVKDVAAHLLGGNLGRLSFQRDRMPRARASAAPASPDELLAFINRANAEWVAACARISPSVLSDFLELTDRQVHAFFKTLKPDEPAEIAVSWAGEALSANWFDIAREYTEKWLHQQHIRDAVGKPGMNEPRFFCPVLDTFMRALPYTYRAVDAPEGTALNITSNGPSGGAWSLVRRGTVWQLFRGASPTAAAQVSLPDETAWRLFTKGTSPESALLLAGIEGDRALAAHMLQMVSIVA